MANDQGSEAGHAGASGAASDSQLQHLKAELDAALARQAATADILKIIATSPGDVQPVFDAIADSARRLSGGLSAIVTRVVGDYLHLAAFTEGSEAGRLALQAMYPMSVSGPNVHCVAVRTAEVVMRPDIEHDPTADAERKNVARMRGFRSILVVPLLHEGRSIGTIGVARGETGAFDERIVELLKSFADQAVIAIENARLFEDVQAKTRDITEALKHQTGSANILKVIASSPADVDPVLEAIVVNACDVCEANDAVVLLREGDNLRFSAHHGPIAVNVEKWPISPGWTAGRAVLERRTIHVGDVFSPEGDDFPDARALSSHTGTSGIRSVVSAPLMREGEAIGALLLRRTEPRAFSDKQIALLQTFADQAVIAIENARLINETKEALARQTATADILKVIASSPSDVQPVFQAIADRSNTLLGGLSTAVFSISDDLIRLTAFTPTNPEADEALRGRFPRQFSSSPQYENIRAGRPHFVPDTEETVDNLRNLARMRGYRSMLFMPLMRGGAPIGMISVTRVESGPFSDQHVQLLQTFADQAVIAIENARLFNETKEALERQTASADVLRIISRSVEDATPVFNAILDSCHRLFSPYGTALYLVDGDMVRGVAGRGFARGDWGADETPLADSTTGEAIATRRPIQIADLADDPHMSAADREELRQNGGMSILYVPLMSGTRGTGSLVLARMPSKPFVEHEIDFIRAFADQAVIAIENARLFDEVKQRTRELSQSLDDLRNAQDRLVQTEKLASLGQLTAGIAHEIKNPLNFVNNFAALSTDLTDELNEILRKAPLDAGVRDEVDEIAQMLKSNLEKIVQHGKRADSIVRNMLLHSREGSGEQRPTDINALVDEALALAYHGARAEKPEFNVELQRDFDAGAGMVGLFPQEITRVLLNLISNGFYAGAKRREQAGEGFEPSLRATTRNLGPSVEIRIRDNGVGIPPDVREKMFNPFYTTKPPGEGTGLGLSMSHDIVVKQHRGTIDVTTEPGAYTEFIVTLPRGGAS